jgi:hypothetical protein
MNIIGLGKTGCVIAEKFSKYPQYKVFKLSIEEGNIEEQTTPEEYESKTSHAPFTLDGPIDFILSGDEIVIASSLKILEGYKNHEIRIIYIRPSQRFATGLQTATDRVVFNVLQEYTRSNKFVSFYVISYEMVAKMVGKIPIVGYYDKLNTVIADTIHMLNYLDHIEGSMDTFMDMPTTYCMKTIGLMDIDTGVENLFYDLDEVRDKRYYYSINEEQLNNDGDLFDSINQQVEESITDITKAMFGVYPSQYKENYCYVVYSSPHIQGIK